MLVPPRSRMMLIAVLRRAAMTWGPWPVRTLEWSSPSVTSRTQCRQLSMVQCERIQSASSRGSAVAVAQGGDRVHRLHRGLGRTGTAASADDLDRPGAVREQGCLRRAIQVEDLDRAGLGPAVADGPVAPPGHLGPGQPGQRSPQRGLVALDGE